MNYEESLEPSPSDETEASTRKSQRTPKKKVIVEYGYVAKRRKAKKRLDTNATRKIKRISRRPAKPRRIALEHHLIDRFAVPNIKQEHITPDEQWTKENNENQSTTIENSQRSVRSTPATPKVYLSERRPDHNVRYDGSRHFPNADEIHTNGTRCKREGCKLKSKFYCMKCKVHLCIKTNMNCFYDFHTLSKGHNVQQDARE